MIDVFKQIKRFENVEFQEGVGFEFTLAPQTIKETIIPCDSPISINSHDVLHHRMLINKTYRITVKRYMTEPSSSTFDFQDKWNNGVPMPMITMVGKVIRETRGMVYMELHGQAEPTCNCLHCGKTLTNKISMLYGIGPICGQHYGINPFDTEEELNANFEELKNQISNIKWSGWIIKSAIKNWEEL